MVIRSNKSNNNSNNNNSSKNNNTNNRKNGKSSSNNNSSNNSSNNNRNSHVPIGQAFGKTASDFREISPRRPLRSLCKTNTHAAPIRV